ncbi:MAG: translation initiation factor IF-2 [Anaerolineaceae bacterium]|nr:translation initiation factor IF-2 [Anaerolineaceae bacterium]MCB9098465.1 translation initiation factor IF-2 [Anaerolineales bacterium]
MAVSIEKERTADMKKSSRTIEIPQTITVRDLADKMSISPIEVIKVLMGNGIMANINQQIDFDTVTIIGEDMGFEVVPPHVEELEVQEEEHELPIHRRLIAQEDPANLQTRPPVVTVLGHVDHGKTTLLDAIRHTQVVKGESGGITQHIGAYQVFLDDRPITFLDTPGHAAFTAMRARGTQVTDLAILVVAADDGVMPQTREAVEHARAAQVPILVALNKIDKNNANPDRVKQELAEIGLLVEEWGGDTVCVPLSALRNQGIDDLLENILLITEVSDLKANPNRPAQGVVIEGRLDKRRGVIATLLVQNGQLKAGDFIVVGSQYGRIRAMFNDKGKKIKEAGLSVPASVMGLSEVPEAGDFFEVVANEKAARAIVQERIEVDERNRQSVERRPVSLEEFFRQRGETGDQTLRLIVKADVQGSLEPIVNSLKDLAANNLKVKILLEGTGGISESDVNLAVASQAIVVGFHVGVDPAAERLAEAEGVDIRLYEIIYKLIEDIEKALKGLLEPEYADKTIGQAEVRAVFKIPKRGNIAGCYVLDGHITRNSFIRVRRNGNVLHEGKVSSLKRFTEDVRDVASGFECGIGVDGFNDFEERDILEAYVKERVN